MKINAREWLVDPHKRSIVLTALSAVCLVWSFLAGGHGTHGGGQSHAVHLWIDPALGSILLSGIPIVYTAFKKFFTQFNIRAGLLISIALLAAVSIGEYFAAGEVAFIMALGEILEGRTLRKARAEVQGLIRLAPQTARVIQPGGAEIDRPATDIHIGDIVRVRPGEVIPVDGLIIQGATSVDQAVITGESLPVELQAGDHTLAGSLNQFGTIDIRTERAGKDSTIQRMIQLVEEAQKRRAPVVRLADRWATVLIPAALLTAVLVGLYTHDWIRAVTILIVFCPCALALATPTAVMAGIGNLSRNGILVKSGEALENMGKVTQMALDKTGTLTTGRLALADCISLDAAFTADDVLNHAASVESRSEHPVAQAIRRAAEAKGWTPGAIDDFEMLPGRGVRTVVDGHTYLAGNQRLMDESGIAWSDEATARATAFVTSDKVPLWLARDGRLMGCLAVEDTLRPEAAEIVSRLHREGISRVLLLTGDHVAAAERIGRLAGVDDIRAELLPADKVGIVQSLVDQGISVAMVGDGINDAPAFKTATVGIAMGGVGSDISVDAADIVLMQDNIQHLPGLKKMARLTLRTIGAGILFSLCVNAGAIVMAANGWMGPVAGALVHNVGSVLVVGNAALLFRRRVF